MKYLFLAIAILAEVGATTAMKLSDGFSKPAWGLATAAGYAVAFYFLSMTLKSIPTGVAYAIWAGAGIVLISLAAWAFNGQRPDAAAVVGMAFIVTGVVIINAFSKMAAH